MASELLKNRALIQKLKEPEIPRVNFDLESTGFEELFTLPEPKPEKLLNIQEENRKGRLLDSLNKIGGGLMDESVDFINREEFDKGSPGELKIPLTSEQKEILEDVYGVKTFKAAKKKFGNKQAQDIIFRIRADKVYKGMKSPIVEGFGPGMKLPTEQSKKTTELSLILKREINGIKIYQNV